MLGLGNMSESKIISQMTQLEIDLKEYNIEASGKRITTLLKGLLDYRSLAAEEFSTQPGLAQSAEGIMLSLKGVLATLPKFSSLIKKHGEHSEPVDALREKLMEQVESARESCAFLFQGLSQAKKSKR